MKKSISTVLVLVLIFMMISSVAMALPLPQGKTVSNTLEVIIQVDKAALKAPEIDELAETSAAGLYDDFVVTVDKDEHGDEIVVGKIEVLDGDADDLELFLFDEGDNGRWIPVGMEGCWFGSPGGEELNNLADRTGFRIAWKDSAKGTYKFAVSIFTQCDGGTFDKEMSSRTFEVKVVQGDPILLIHAFGNGDLPGDDDLTGNPISTTVNAGDEMAYTIEAGLENGVTHVDNLLYIIEIEKDDLAADDFQIVAISGYGEGETEGINDTFVLEGNRLKGYLGPDTGFKFGENPSIPLPARTTFTIRFTTAGEYLINIYAIQVGVQPPEIP